MVAVLDEELAEFGVVDEAAGVGELVPQVAPAGPVSVPSWANLKRTWAAAVVAHRDQVE